ncbi:MBL fold metallo-hydrolase [Yoonia sp. BS5-3]|uniref:MBL fold metallo-hydrolase n=1 Tax=Yoonia phaeophyticola TaxID=3137369 RepID=A0ABZ2V2T9_9RHOB
MTKTAFQPGNATMLAPDLCCVLAPNPSPMTYWGTNTYLLGRDSLAIIDPGPDLDAHRRAILAAIDGRPVTHILLTHSHLDHSPLAKPLGAALNAPVLAFGNSSAGRSAVMTRLAQTGLTGGGEGIDRDFKPDQCLKDNEVLTEAWGQIKALHTPGHIGNHLCFQWKDAVFTGDHVMGWASSLVSPPDGDLTDFMRSCARLKGITAKTHYPGHGGPITDPQARLDWLIAHRRSREAQLLAALQPGPGDVETLTQQLYADVTPALHKAAARNVFAHLVDLAERGRIRATPQLALDAKFELVTGRNADQT